MLSCKVMLVEILITKNYFVIMKFLTNMKSMPVLLHHVDAIVNKKMIFI